jgi:Cu(I)/Ag(I) efflux system membrane fusion protein
MRKKTLIGLLLLFSFGLLMTACGGSYKEVISIEEKGVKVTILSSDGKIKSGNNKIEVRVDPPKPIKELYFYMPPMPGMDEMRDAAALEEVEPGVYRGSLKISMEGPWQIRVVFQDTMITKDVFVPLSKSASAGGGPATSVHGGHIMVRKDKLQLLGVLTEPVQRRDLVKTFSTVGYVSYDLSKIYDVTVRADAWVEDTFGRFEGEYVRKGTPLMKVLSPDIQIALDELRLAEEKGDPELIKKAKEKLEYLKVEEVVRSPVSGVILEQKVYEGGYIKEGQTAYRIADISTVWIVAQIPFKQARYVRKGTLALVTPEDNPESMIEGEVDYIFPEADHMAKTIKVRIRAKNKGILLKPNALVDVLFEVPIGEVVAVPETAVVDTGKRTLVFVEMEPGMFMPVQIKLGRKAEGYYEVKEGLKEGQKVVVKGTFLLDSEAQIRGLYGQGAGGHHHH